MPPRPFRQSLSIGTDICHHPRFSKYFPIHQHLASTTTAISSQSLLFKLFDKALIPAEQRAFWRRFQPSSSSKGSSNTVNGTEQIFWTEKKAEEAAKFLGGRWAAKEATIKAFTAQRRLVLRDVRVWSVGQGKQPLALVIDEVEGGMKKYDSAREVYEKFTLQRRLREELKLLQQGEQRKDGAVLPSSGGLRIIKTPILSRHTARSMEMKKMAPAEQEKETSMNTPPILSKTGILDFSAITNILNQPEETSTSTPATQTPQEVEPQSHQQKLQEEIERLNREELEEDGWDNMQGQIVKLSISHDGEYCVATALAAV
jgi:phosphopantetheinyl transferase (holo-ACP synthase)